MRTDSSVVREVSSVCKNVYMDKATHIPEHCSYDCPIDPWPNTTVPFRAIYGLSFEDVEAL